MSFKLRSGSGNLNSHSGLKFKEMGSSPALKKEIYESYIDEAGNEITKSLGTGSTATQKANEVNRDNQRENANKLKALKSDVETKNNIKIDTTKEDGEANLTRNMSEDQFENYINLKNQQGGSRTLTYTGADADLVRNMNPEEKAKFKKNDFSKSEISGVGGMDINTADMNKEVAASAKLIKK